jgi:hypothetical protein
MARRSNAIFSIVGVALLLHMALLVVQFPDQGLAAPAPTLSLPGLKFNTYEQVRTKY